MDRRRFVAMVGGCGAGVAFGAGVGRAGSGVPGIAVVGGRPQRGEPVRVADPAPVVPVWLPGQFVTHVDVASRKMALTFDDGPSPYDTEPILRTLATHRVRATFFLVGVNFRAYPDIARRVAEAGHQLGNHSVYHTPYRASSLAAQIAPNQEIIREVTGVTTLVSRAPGLTRGQIVLDTCRANGLFEAHTHMSTFDHLSPRYSASTLVSQFVRYHRNGAFAIHHDGGGPRPTRDAIDPIIGFAKSIGYEFVTVDELMRAGRPQPVAVAPARSEFTAVALVDRCSFDAADALRSALSELPSLTYVDRMRIVGELADMEALVAGRN
jgi:peptidoglycan/xylan/chitin deacetylase (PgdA/CDA1 family)